ncbi:MAG: hypothetical protein ACREM2_02925 [Vulcanimicrobiaceae bacterium]
MNGEALRHPAPGSAAARAREFGIDLSLTYRNMFELSMVERLAKLDEHVAEAAERRKSKPRVVGTIAD